MTDDACAANAGGCWGDDLVAIACRESGCVRGVLTRVEEGGAERIVGSMGMGEVGRTLGAHLAPAPGEAGTLVVERVRADVALAEHPSLAGLASCAIVASDDAAGRRIGCLVVGDARERGFGVDEVASLRTLASLAARRVSEERPGALSLEKLTACVPGVMYQFAMDAEGRMRFPYASEQMRSIYFTSPEEAQAGIDRVMDVLHPEDADRVVAGVLASAERLAVWEDRYRVVDPGGEVRWVEGRSRPERLADGSTLWHGYIHDITERVERERRLEEARRLALEASMAKGEFLANVSHEIRTPLGAILGYAEVLEHGGGPALSDEQAEAVRTIRRNGEHLLGLVNDLLDVEKIGAGRLSVERIEVSPEAIVSDVVALLRVRAEAKGLALHVEHATPIPERITSDPTRLRQVLINLVGNAIKFTMEGSIRVRLSMDAAHPERLVVEVIDTGIGMSREQLERVRRFEAFTQGDASTTRRFGGTGLGLRICASIAELLGEGLEIESEAGVGSTFRVRLDTGDLSGVAMREAGACALASPVVARVGGEHERALEGVRVLVAEDGVDNQRLIRHHLERAGARVEVVENGMLACARLEGSGGFELVLMDMMMPVMDGYAATRRLRSRGCALPIVAVTAHASEADRVACVEAGCDAYLAKPLSSGALVGASVRALRGAGAA